MKKILLLTGLLGSLNASAQALFSQNFEGGGTFDLNYEAVGSNLWTVNAAYTGGGTIPAVPDQPGSFTNGVNSKYLHIHNTANCTAAVTCNANYNPADSSNAAAAMFSSFSTIGESGVSLNFWYLCQGEPGVAYGRVEYSTTNEDYWIPVGPQLSGVAAWTPISITNAAFDGNTMLKFRFRWVNGTTGVVGNPALSVDEITVTSAMTTPVTDTIVVDDMLPDVCGDGNVLGFQAFGNYGTGNVFTAQLSDASGSFASPTTLGPPLALESPFSGTQMIDVVYPGAPGNYRVRIISSNPADTSADNGQDFNLHANPTITITATPSVTDVCVGNSISFTASSPGVTQFGWGDGDGMTSNYLATNTATPTGATWEGMTPQYNVSGKSIYGCKGSNSIIITLHDPKLGISTTPADSTICAGQSATLVVGGIDPGATYTWTPSATLNVANQATVTASPTTTTEYTVVAVDPYGCDDTTTVIITVNPSITVSIASTPANGNICSGQSATLVGSGAGTGGTYSWTPTAGLNVSNQASVTATPVLTTQYTVTGTSANGCSNTSNFTVTVQNCAGIDENEAALFALYPNPTSGMVNIDWKTGTTADAVQLLDNSGRLISEIALTNNAFSLDAYPAGTYFVRIAAENSYETVRVTKH